MRVPDSIKILLYAHTYMMNVTNTGRIADFHHPDIDILEAVLTRLDVSYKVYSYGYQYIIGNFDIEAYQEFDLFIGNMPLSERGLDASSYPYWSVDITFAIEKPNHASKTFPFLRPFTLNIWIGILAFLILGSLMHYLMFRRKHSLASAFFYMYGTLLGKYYHNWRPKSASQKMMITSWSLGFAIFILSYASVLLSFLSVPDREKGITNFDELLEAVHQGRVTAVAFEHSLEKEILYNTVDETLMFLAEHIDDNPKIKRVDALHAIKQDVAVISIRSELEAFYGGARHFISQDSILTYNWVIMNHFRGEEPGFCCTEKLNENIHWMWATGITQKIYGDAKFKETLLLLSEKKDSNTVDQDAVRPLSLSDMAGTFYFLIGGLLLGFLCCLCELLTFHCCPP